MRLASAIFLATLPFAAGFAFSGSSLAQGIQYEGPGANVPVVGGQQGGGDYMRTFQLEQQIRDLTNQLEQRDFQIRQLQSAFDKFSADTNMRLQDLEGKLSGTITGTEPRPTDSFETPAAPDVPPAPTAVQNEAPVSGALDDANGAFKPDAASQSRPDRNLGEIIEGASGTDGAVTAGKPQTISAAQAYDQAFSYLQKNNYADAQRAFGDFLKNHPSHPLAANAKYWLGETYFAQTQYTTAAKTFAKAFQEHPQGQKAPDALFKLALTLEKMNKKDDACLTLQELNKRFTAGPASILKRASEEGQRMGCKS